MATKGKILLIKLTQVEQTKLLRFKKLKETQLLLVSFD